MTSAVQCSREHMTSEQSACDLRSNSGIWTVSSCDRGAPLFPKRPALYLCNHAHLFTKCWFSNLTFFLEFRLELILASENTKSWDMAIVFDNTKSSFSSTVRSKDRRTPKTRVRCRSGLRKGLIESQPLLSVVYDHPVHWEEQEPVPVPQRWLGTRQDLWCRYWS